MSLAFIVVDTATNMVTQTGYSPMKWNTVHSVFYTSLDDSDSVYQAITKNQTSQSYDNFMAGRPYLKGSYDGTNLTVTLFNPPSPAPTNATLSILGQTFTASIANNVITFPVSVHPSITTQSIECAVIVEGFTPIYVQFGGGSNNITVQLGKDASDVLRVVPYYNADLATYYTSKAFNATWQPIDIMTAIGVLFDRQTRIMKALQNTTYTPITLSPAEDNSENDIRNNILPNIPVAFASLVNSDGTFDNHWNSFRTHEAQSHTQMNDYMQDVAAISQYAQLH